MASRQPQVSGVSKRMCSSRALALTLVFWALLEFDNVDGHAHEVKSNANDLFATGIEESVKSLAASVLSNYRRRPGLWESGTCNTSCSVFSCQTKQLDDKTHNGAQCLKLPANSNLSSDQPCTRSDGNVKKCSKALLSNESYVLLPFEQVQLDQTKISPDQQLTICSQMALDNFFPQIYDNHSTKPFDDLVWSMFGAANGVFRIYPGLESSPTECKQRFDPRKRPWHRAITGVSKQVVILLDGGGPMVNRKMSNPGGDTLFNGTTRIVNEFLDTLNKDDTVSVYKFDHTGLAQTDHVKIKMPDPSNDMAVTDAFAPLRRAMKNMSDTITSGASQANLTAALENLLLPKDTEFDTSSSQNLKVLFIFTRGLLADRTSISVPSNSSIAQALTRLSVRPFIYQLEDRPDPLIQSVACALNASYNVIIPSDYVVNDPLSSLQSFYSYVAKIRHDNEDKPIWIQNYNHYFREIVDTLVAVSYPVFDGDVLVGVASIGVLSNVVKLHHVRTDDEIKQLVPGPTLNCSANLRESYVPDPIHGNQTSGGLCPDGKLSATEYGKRTCCDDHCSAETSIPAGAIAGIVVGGCLLLTAFICLLCFRKAILKFFGCCKDKEKIQMTQGIGEVVKQDTKGTSAQAINSQEEVFGKVIG